MRSYASTSVVIAVAAGLITACLGSGEDRVTSIDATGSVEGLVYFDANGSGEPDATDPPVALVGVRLVVGGTTDTLVRTLSDQTGIFSMRTVPVGIYQVVVDPVTIPDSLQLVAIEPEFLLASKDDTASSFIALGFATLSVAEARQLAPGARVFVEGIALNAQPTFGDQTVHVAGATGAIRVLQVGEPNVFAGDSVRVLGTTATLDGQSVLTDPTLFRVSTTSVPPPAGLTTAVAAAAEAGSRDAALVRVVDVTITATATVADGVLLTVNDGSGDLAVLLDEDAPFLDPAAFVPGLVIDATGVLVPTPGVADTWQLKPRSDADLTVK
ncbi:MAG: hypothetical protein PVI01_13545 [Gemmatimonadales bacterium]|jgi:hypothetical protein